MEYRLMVPPVVKVLGAEVSPRVSYGHSVMAPPPGNPSDYPDPQWVYLIYLTQATSGKWIVRHMLSPITVDVLSTATYLYVIAEKNLPSSSHVGDAFINLIWTTPCHLFFVLDSTSARFVDFNNPELDPILFVDEKYKFPGGTPIKVSCDPNYSFYRGLVTEIYGRSALYCRNYLKADEDGTDLIYPYARTYGFEIRFLADFEGSRQMIGIDPDGQNQGPHTLELEFRTEA